MFWHKIAFFFTVLLIVKRVKKSNNYNSSDFFYLEENLKICTVHTAVQLQALLSILTWQTETTEKWNICVHLVLHKQKCKKLSLEKKSKQKQKWRPKQPGQKSRQNDETKERREAQNGRFNGCTVSTSLWQHFSYNWLVWSQMNKSGMNSWGWVPRLDC